MPLPRRKNLATQLAANPAVTKTLFRKLCCNQGLVYIMWVFWGDRMAYKQGLFGASFRSSIRSNVSITNLLRLRLEVMSIKMCIFRASQNKRAAHELGNNSKTLGGVQQNKRVAFLVAL